MLEDSTMDTEMNYTYEKSYQQIRGWESEDGFGCWISWTYKSMKKGRSEQPAAVSYDVLDCSAFLRWTISASVQIAAYHKHNSGCSMSCQEGMKV